jgi:hypothetical protein
MRLPALVTITVLCSASLSAQNARTPRNPARDSAVAQRVAGCYELADGGWRTDSAIAKIDSVPHEPIRFELMAKPARSWESLSNYDQVTYFEVRTDSIAWWGRDLFETWNMESYAEPIITVSRPMPMAGFALRLTPRGNDLVGTISAFTDAVPPNGQSEASQPVTARRIGCAGRN